MYNQIMQFSDYAILIRIIFTIPWLIFLLVCKKRLLKKVDKVLMGGKSDSVDKHLCFIEFPDGSEIARKIPRDALGVKKLRKHVKALEKIYRKTIIGIYDSVTDKYYKFK